MYLDQLMVTGVAINLGFPERTEFCSSLLNKVLEFCPQLLDAMSSKPLSSETMATLRKGSYTFITAVQFKLIVIAKTLNHQNARETCAASSSQTV